MILFKALRDRADELTLEVEEFKMSSSKRSARGGEGQRPRRGSLLSDYTAAKTDDADTASGMIYFFMCILIRKWTCTCCRF